MKKIFALTALLILFCATAFAKTVTVTGQGSTQRAAIHNAMRLAIERELGANVNAKTYVQNNRVVLDELSTHSDGFVSAFNILSERVENGVYIVDLQVEIDSAALNSKFLTLAQKKNLVKTNADNPRVAVYAFDADGKNYPEVENEILAALQRQGFTQTVDLAQVETVTQKRLANAATDSALRKMLADNFHVDLLVLSEVKIVDKNYSLASRLISVNTGKIIHAENSSGNVGMFTARASETTLRLAARRAGFAIANAALKSAANVNQHITLLVSSATFSKLGGNLNSATNFVKNLDGVNDAYVRTMQGAVEFDVDFDGTAADLAAELELAGYKILQLTSNFVKI